MIFWKICWWIKGLVQENYIQVPEKEVSILDEAIDKIDQLEKDLNKRIEENIQLSEACSVLFKKDYIREKYSHLSDTEIDKIQKLSEGIPYINAKDFGKKINLLVESYGGNSDTKRKLNLFEENSDLNINDINENDESIESSNGSLRKIIR
jgi:hypothetical protein